MLALGKYPAVGLAEARSKAKEARAQLAEGINPSMAKKAAKAAAQAAVDNAFEVIAREWYSKELPRWSEGHARRVIESLEADAFPELGQLPITSLTTPMILNCIRKIEKRGAIETGQRVQQRIGAVFRYAIQTGRAEYNPIADLVGVLRVPKV